MRKLHTVADPEPVRHPWTPMSLNWGEFVMVALIVVVAILSIMLLLWR